MSRYRGPKIRIVRRLGELPGLTTKTTTRETLPGQHKKVRGKQSNVSSYSIRLQEKQKLRYNYGLTEKQMLSYVKEARRLKGSTGSVLIQLLEMRLDNIVYRLGIGNTIPASRQIVNHGHIYVNNKKVTIPSFQCSPNDTIEIRNKQNSKKLAERLVPPLFAFTELLAITVTTFNPPKKPLTILASPSARRSLFTLDLLFLGSSLSTALILKRDSITAIKVIEKTAPINFMSKVLSN